METYLIGIDTLKHFFQVCGVTKLGQKTFERKLSRAAIGAFIREHGRCIVAMEV